MSAPLPITDAVTIPAPELSWSAARASGPGGQNVNKVASKVELRFDLARTTALDDGTRARLRALAATRLDAAGQLVVTSQKTRDQSRNLEDARAKLRALIVKALTPPTPRKPTKPGLGAKRRRLDDKHRQAAKKRERSSGSED